LEGEIALVQLDAPAQAPVFDALLPPGILDQDAAHGLGRGGEEMAATVPWLVCVAPDQPQIRLVDQGGRLQRLPRLFVGQTLPRESAQLVVDQRQQLPRGVRIACFDCAQQFGDVSHQS
jgi:hypothetical protein